MLEGIRPGTEKRCEMLRLYLEKGISQSTFRELILPMEGKSEEEKEKIAEEIIQKLTNSTNSKTSG